MARNGTFRPVVYRMRRTARMALRPIESGVWSMIRARQTPSSATAVCPLDEGVPQELATGPTQRRSWDAKVIEIESANARLGFRGAGMTMFAVDANEARQGTQVASNRPIAFGGLGRFVSCPHRRGIVEQPRFGHDLALAETPSWPWRATDKPANGPLAGPLPSLATLPGQNTCDAELSAVI